LVAGLGYVLFIEEIIIGMILLPGELSPLFGDASFFLLLVSSQNDSRYSTRKFCEGASVEDGI
jgi:hypothetical protein